MAGQPRTQCGYALAIAGATKQLVEGPASELGATFGMHMHVETNHRCTELLPYCSCLERKAPTALRTLGQKAPCVWEKVELRCFGTVQQVLIIPNPDHSGLCCMPVICSHQRSHLCLEVGELVEWLCAAVHMLNWPSLLPGMQCDQGIGFFWLLECKPTVGSSGLSSGAAVPRQVLSLQPLYDGWVTDRNRVLVPLALRLLMHTSLRGTACLKHSLVLI